MRRCVTKRSESVPGGNIIKLHDVPSVIHSNFSSAIPPLKHLLEYIDKLIQHCRHDAEYYDA